jgi:two-component system, NarL family, nitrate/nitrite response regulator NarL
MPKSMPTDDTITIVVVDDHPIIREGLVAVLDREDDLQIVGEGGTALEAFELAEQHLPHVMLLDVNMPGGGLTALARITAAYPAIAVIILTVKEDSDTVGAALKAGARGYVLKGVSGSELATAVRTIRRGDSYITPTLAARLLAEARDAKPGSAAHANTPNLTAGLSVREEQILKRLADGASNKQIGADLSLSESTIKHYMTNLMQKLQVKNRVEAALLAQRQRGGSSE